MSTFRVPLTKVLEVRPCPNSHSLDIIKIYDWQVVTGKGNFKVNDYVIYIPIESIIPEVLENRIFKNSKVKLNKHRVKTIKLRGEVSQGLCCSVQDAFSKSLDELQGISEEMDLSVILGITKFEPPESSIPSVMQINKNANIYKIKEFKEYTDVEHGKYYDRTLQDGEEVMIMQKIHGTNARYGWFKNKPRNLYQKILKFIGLFPEWEFAWGSRRTQIQSKWLKKHQGYKNEKQGVEFGDVYTKMINQYLLKYKISKGYSIYGEIYGTGIQKNYMYDCPQREHRFRVFDVRNNETGEWLNSGELIAFCKDNNLPMCPIVYTGPWSNEIRDKCLTKNVLSKEPNEGIVCRPVKERTGSCGRILLKWINPEYLLKDQTEFH